MADPHIQSPMDFWDKLTVVIYRLGFLFAGIGMFTLFIARFWREMYLDAMLLGTYLIMIGAMFCASCLHIYLKHFRLILQAATWLGLLLGTMGSGGIALGGALVTLGGLCLKEYYCFRIPALNFMPVLVALLWLGDTLAMPFLILNFLVAILNLICAILFISLFIAKCRMPLHFDIGDKSKYQI